MRTAVLGARGQLGSDLCQRLRGEVIPLNRADVELTDSAKLRQVLTDLRPDVVVNCAAYNFVDRAETEREAAMAVNAWAVHDLAKICRDLNSCLVQFSTDYVFGFDEQRQTPLTEVDSPGPLSVYGLSKLAGEYLVRSTGPKHLVIRTCGLYGVRGSGGKGGNFVETMLRLAKEGKSLRIVNDQRCTPSFTVDVADATIGLIEAGATGLFHVTNAGDCTWCEFASEIMRASGIDVKVAPITSAEFGAAARRPPYSVLSNQRLKDASVKAPRNWREALATYLQERTNR